MNAGKTSTSFSETTASAEDFLTTEEQTGIRKVLTNVIAFRSVSSPIDVESLATALVERLLAAKPDGGTYDPRSNTFASFDDDEVYLVSVPRHEFRLRGAPSIAALIGWLSRIRRLLIVEQYYLGWWRDGDVLVFDVSIPIHGDREIVLAIAHSWGQDAVYHPSSSTVLDVPVLSERAA